MLARELFFSIYDRWLTIGYADHEFNEILVISISLVRRTARKAKSEKEGHGMGKGAIDAFIFFFPLSCFSCCFVTFPQISRYPLYATFAKWRTGCPNGYFSI